HLFFFFFFSSRRRHTRFSRDWSSDVCSSDLAPAVSGRWLNLCPSTFCAIVLRSTSTLPPAIIQPRVRRTMYSSGNSVEYPDAPKIGRASCRERVSVSEDDAACTKKQSASNTF